MEFYKIDEDVEIKPALMQRRGQPSSAFVQEYDSLQKWISTRYLNHGNNMAHTLSLVFNQLNKKRDKLVFSENGRSLNLYFSRGLYFAKNCSNKYTNQKNSYYRKTSNGNLGLYISPAMYLYNKNSIEKLVEEEKCTLYDGSIPSYDHGKTVNAYEYRLNDREDLPQPVYIITGRSFCAKLRQKNRVDYKQYTKLISEVFPDTILIHIPHVSFGTGKDKYSTANEKHPLTGKRVLDILYNLEQGKYTKYKQQK